MKKNCHLIALTLLALLGSGCAAHVDGLQIAPSFSYEAARDSHIGVAGVTSSFSSLTQQTANVYAAILAAQIREERKAFRVVSAGAITLAMGAEAHQMLIDQFARNGALTRDTLASVTAAMPEIGYLTLARIEKNEVSRRRESHDIYEKEKEDKDKKGKHIGVEHISRSLRNISVFITIYDMTTSQIVWNGTLSQTAIAENSYLVQNNVVAQVIDLLGQMNKRDNEKYPYPPYPSNDNLLKRIFNGFAENLPEE